ncbi:MAG: oligosaccharide repeat unit polymerase [Lentisphaerae bacterium]|nr:oligosaccharide repeat unit polymerase [Lentisphaerota bacterium]
MQYLLVLCAFLTCGLFISRKTPFLLRHIFLIYVFAIYNIAPQVLGSDEAEYYGWFLEFMAVLILFVIGYGLGLRLARSKRVPHASIRAISQHKMRLLKLGLLALLLYNALVLAKGIMTLGVTKFYAGAQLVAVIQNYGKADPGGAISYALGFILSTLTVVLLYVWVEWTMNQPASFPTLFRYDTKKRLALRFSFIWLVLFPLVSFSRSGVAFGALTYLAIRSKLSKKLLTLSTLLLGLLALAFFVYVGLARAESLNANSGVRSLFISELTPWSAYREIKANIEQLGYQYGNTIFPSLLLKVIPRGLWPDKPYNSSGYFMTMLHPDQFQAGYALPPTYMGDLYLNFGLPGMLVGIVLLGAFTGRIDGIVIYRQFKHIGLFFIVFASYFTLLRNNIADSMFFLLVNVVLYFIVSKWTRVSLRLIKRSYLKTDDFTNQASREA